MHHDVCDARQVAHTPQLRVLPGAYTHIMVAWQNPDEDWRGVDLTQIRRQLRLPIADRVREMVHAANVMMAVRQHAQQARSRKVTDV